MPINYYIFLSIALFVIGIIGCYVGYNTEQGTQGVGRAANTAVVLSIFMIFIVDLLATQIADALHLIT